MSAPVRIRAPSRLPRKELSCATAFGKPSRASTAALSSVHVASARMAHLPMVVTAVAVVRAVAIAAVETLVVNYCTFHVNLTLIPNSKL